MFSLVIRVKKVTKMTETVATGVLSGVVKVAGFFTSSVANSKASKKFFDLLPGEMVLASFDGFSMCIIFSIHPFAFTCNIFHVSLNRLKCYLLHPMVFLIVGHSSLKET